ncbi:MAG: hypothetical protein M4579_002516 [Chaenotheca gracillima]|nr:MAG: hypothetical protein M4579_002516 [Chaenotheca gracillima]
MSTTQEVNEALRQATAGSEEAPAELTVVVDELLNSLSTKFASVSSEMFSKMDEMSRRLDSLETALQSGEGEEQK